MSLTTPNLHPQNDYVAKLLQPVTLTDTTIFIDGSVPTGIEGFLDIGEGLTSHERIFYNSKGSNFVTCPDVATGRGIGSTSVTEHVAGETVKMKWNAEWWLALQDQTAITPISKVVQITTAPADSTSPTGVYKVVPLSITASLKARPMKLTAIVEFGQRTSASATTSFVTIKEGSTVIGVPGNGQVNGSSANINSSAPVALAYFTPTAGTHTYDVYISLQVGGDMALTTGMAVLEYV